MKATTTITEYPLTAAGIGKALEALADGGSNAVAVRLICGQHRGQRDSIEFCPVANRLAYLYPGEEVLVDGTVASVGTVLDVLLPTAVAVFTVQFDAGLYLELDIEWVPAGASS